MTDEHTAADAATPDTPAADIFDPVGYVVLAFGNAADADTARDSLLGGGYAPSELLRYSADDVLAKAEAADNRRTLFSYLREENELVEDYEAIARDGGAFLLVRAESESEASRIGAVGRRGDLKRAVHYGPLTFTELR